MFISLDKTDLQYIFNAHLNYKCDSGIYMAQA